MQGRRGKLLPVWQYPYISIMEVLQKLLQIIQQLLFGRIMKLDPVSVVLLETLLWYPQQPHYMIPLLKLIKVPKLIVIIGILIDIISMCKIMQPTRIIPFKVLGNKVRVVKPKVNNLFVLHI